MLYHFSHYNHICMLFPLLSISVFDFLKLNSYHPFPLSHVQSFAKQILQATSFVHSHGIIHTDLKPGNGNRAVTIMAINLICALYFRKFNASVSRF